MVEIRITHNDNLVSLANVLPIYILQNNTQKLRIWEKYYNADKVGM